MAGDKTDQPERRALPESPEQPERQDLPELQEPRAATRWAWRAGALAMLLLGWVFIAWQNKFYVTAPVVFVCLGYLAVITTVYNLWRTGASAVASDDDEGVDSTWGKPTGALGELEREKRTLLKAIKEAEFDHQMGKLSQRDVDDMIRGYRVRAIEVIKEIDRISLGAAGGPRDQILREVRARLSLDAQSNRKAKAAVVGKQASAASGKTRGKKQAAASRDPAATAAESTATAVGAAEASPPGEAADEAGAPGAPGAPGANEHAANGGAARPAAAPPTGKAAIEINDEDLNADSTTAPEPRHDAAKEAMS